MRIVNTRADVHVQAHQMQAVAVDLCQRGGHVGVPNAVFAVLAAGVGFVAVAMAKTGVDAQPHLVTSLLGCAAGHAQLTQHVHRPGIHRDAVGHHAGQRGVIEQVGGENDVLDGVASHHGAVNFTQRHRIDLHALLAHQAQQMHIGIGLLRIANDVKRLQRRNARPNGRGVVNPQRRAVVLRQSAKGVRGKWVHAADGARFRLCKQCSMHCKLIQSGYAV